MKSHSLLLPLMALLLLPEAQAGENIYKWVDKDGKVHFGDRPETQEETQQVKISDKGLPTETVAADHNVPVADTTDAAPVDEDTPVFDRKRIMGIWREESFNEITEAFYGDGSYVRKGKVLGSEFIIKGNWELSGNILRIQVNSEMTILPNGEKKLDYKASTRKRTLVSVGKREMSYLWEAKEGEMMSTLTR